jgi:hypothetical protein
MSDDVTGTPWSDAEVDLIVADYFSMLVQELAGTPYNKAQHNRALQQHTGRKPGSIERKHQNISAVLKLLGLPWINGYKPLANFQVALIDGIARYLALKGEPVIGLASAPPVRVFQPEELWIGPPPTPSPEDLKATDDVRRLIRKFDPAARDARNRALGKRGEELVFQRERLHLISAGRADLARKIEWTSEERGDGAGYDIRSFNPDGSDRLIEVKTTNGAALTPFYLTENERAFSEERPDAFRLLRLHDFRLKPTAFELTPPLSRCVRLNPTVYRASF